MFRSLFPSFGKFTTCLGGSAAAAAAVVALSDKELKKKPEWYQQAVLNLESSIKKMGKYKPIESLEVLNSAQDVFSRVSDYNSAELLWRLGRTLLEKSDLVHDHHEKEHLIHEALEYLHKALTLEQKGDCAGCHKWYAVALTKSGKKNVHDEVIQHLEKAVKIDSKDPFAWHYLGAQHYNKKNYSEAINALQKAEEIREDFSAANKYYLGIAHYYNGNKEEALKVLKKTLSLPTRIGADGRAKIRAKEFLLVKLKQKWEEIDPSEDY